MLYIPRLALFPAGDQLRNVIQDYLVSEYYSVRSVRSVRELLELIDDEQDGFDAILIPSPLALNLDIAELCSLIRGVERLSSSPLVGVFEESLPEDLFSMGCDLCLELPCNPELLHLQLSALGRFHRQLEARIIRAFEAAGLRRSTIAALNACSQALLLCDRDLGITFANSKARELCGFSDPAKKEEYSALQDQLRAQISPNLEQSMMRRVILRRPHGSEWQASINMIPIELDASLEAGYCLALADSGIERQLNSLLAFSDRTRELALHTLGALMASLPESAIGVPLDVISELASNEPQLSSLDGLLAGLIQVLDSLLDEAVSLKIFIQPQLTLRLRKSQAVRVFAELILSAQQYMAGAGHMKLSSQLTSPEIVEFSLEISAIEPEKDQHSESATILHQARGFDSHGQVFSNLKALLNQLEIQHQVSAIDNAGGMCIKIYILKS